MISYIDTILQESSGEFFQVKGQRGKDCVQQETEAVIWKEIRFHVTWWHHLLLQQIRC